MSRDEVKSLPDARRVVGLLAGFAMLLCFAAPGRCAPGVESPLRIVAEVNDEEITRSDLESELAAQLRLVLPLFSSGAQRTLQKRMLQTIIDRRLLLQAARREGLLPSAAEVALTLQQLHPHPGTTGSELRPQDEEQLRRMMREDLAIARYLSRHVFGPRSASPTPSSAAPHTALLTTPPLQLRLRLITIRRSEPPETGRRLVEQLLDALRADPGLFPQLARRHSSGAGRIRGGDLGYVTVNQLAPAWREVALTLQPGEISPPLEDDVGLHLLKLENRRQTADPAGAMNELLNRALQQEADRSALRLKLDELRNRGRVIVYLK